MSSWSWTDGTDVRLHLRSGEVVTPASDDLPPSAIFSRLMAERGLKVVAR